jgi:hypothetical protein
MLELNFQDMDKGSKMFWIQALLESINLKEFKLR